MECFSIDSTRDRVGLAGPLCLVTWTAIVVFLSLPASAQTLPLAQLITVDVPAVQASGDFLLDGAPTPPTSAEIGELSLDGLFGPETATPVGATPQQGYGPTWIVPGSYRPIYRLIASFTAQLPLNARAALGPAVVVDGSAPLDFELETVELTLELMLDGLPFPSASGEEAMLWLRDVETGAEFPIGSAGAGPAVFRVLPGTYDLVYGYVAGDLLPLNSHAVIAPAVDLSADRPLTIDLRTLVHAVSATLDGAPFPSSPYEHGTIRLENFETGDVISWGPTHVPAGFQRILPGTYDVTYAHQNGNLIVPLNQHAVVAEDVEIALPVVKNQISFSAIDVQAEPVDRVITLDGAAFPASAYERGDLVLVGEQDDEVPLGATHVDPGTIQVVSGRYDVHYRWRNGSSLVPRNENVRVRQAFRVNGPTTLALDIETVEVDFEFLLDGVPFPASAYERGDFTLIGETPGDRLPIGTSSELQASVRIVPGSYDVEYDYVTGSSIVPRNQAQIMETDLELLTTQARALEVETLVVVPTFLQNGLPFPESAADRGEIRLSAPGGGVLPLGETDEVLPESVIAIQGAYRMEYGWLAGDDVPQNRRVALGYTFVPEPAVPAALAPGLLLLGRLRRRASRRGGARRGRARRWPGAGLVATDRTRY